MHLELSQLLTIAFSLGGLVVALKLGLKWGLREIHLKLDHQQKSIDRIVKVLDRHDIKIDRQGERIAKHDGILKIT